MAVMNLLMSAPMIQAIALVIVVLLKLVLMEYVSHYTRNELLTHIEKISLARIDIVILYQKPQQRVTKYMER